MDDKTSNRAPSGSSFNKHSSKAPVIRPYSPSVPTDKTLSSPTSPNGKTFQGSRSIIGARSPSVTSVGSFPQSFSNASPSVITTGSSRSSITQRSLTPYVGLAALLSIKLDKRLAAPIVDTARIPNVRLQDFDSYLKSLAGTFEQWKVNRDRRGSTSGEGDSSGKIADLHFLRRGLLPVRQDKVARNLSSTLSRLNLSTADQDLPSPTTPTPVVGVEVEIPAQFFEESFNLKDIKTFQWCQSQDQSHLAACLANVEQQLATKIHSRSARLFSSLSEMRQLAEQTHGLLNNLAEMRTNLQQVSEQTAKKAEYIRLLRVRRNIGATLKSASTLAELCQTEHVVSDLLSHDCWSTALELLESMRREEWISQLDALKATKDRVKKKYWQVVEMAEHAFVERLLQGLEIDRFEEKARSGYVECVKLAKVDDSRGLFPPAVIERQEPCSPDSAREVRITSESIDSRGIQSEEELRGVIAGLERVGRTENAITLFRDITKKRITQIMEAHNSAVAAELPSHSKTDDPSGSPRKRAYTSMKELEISRSKARESKTGTFAAALSAAPFAHLLAFMASYCKTIDRIFQILQANMAFVLILLPTRSAGMHDVLSFILEASQSYLPSASAHIPNPALFKRLQELMTSWILRFETRTRLTCFGLRAHALSQAKAFLESYGNESEARLKGFLETERWTPTDVTVDFQKIVDDLEGEGSSTSSKSSKITGDSSPVLTARSSATTATSTQSQLRILGEDYFVVMSTLMLLRSIQDFTSLHSHSSTASLLAEVVTRIVSLIKHFNTVIAALVLGAGAVKMGEVKSITPRHLALASRSLAAAAALTKVLKSWCENRMKGMQAWSLSGLDSLIKELNDHGTRISSKFLSIMTDRLLVHIRQPSEPLPNSQLSSSQSSDPNEPPLSLFVTSDQPYLTIAKETGTLRRVLDKYLPAATVGTIMSPIFEMYSSSILEEITHSAKRLKDEDKENVLEWVRSMEKENGMDGALEKGVLNLVFGKV